MNDIYGVDPKAPDRADELALLMRMFGPTEGRFIADFPIGWIDEVKKDLEREPELARARALAWIQRRRGAILNVGRIYKPERSWPENSELLRGSVKGLIGTRKCPPTLMPIERALFDPDALPDARGGFVSRSAAAYAQASSPLFALTPKVVLVDRYFRLRLEGTGRPANRQRKVLALMLAEARRRRRVEAFVLYIARDHALNADPDGRRFRQDLIEVAEEAGAADIGLEYRLLGDSEHGRYLLGTGCGIQFDHGFDTANDGSMNHVHWLSESEVAPLLARYDLPSS